jgi:hypothetical protein
VGHQLIKIRAQQLNKRNLLNILSSLKKWKKKNKVSIKEERK